LASGSDENAVRLWNWNVETDEFFILAQHETRVRSVTFSPNGEIIASSSEDKNIQLWDVKNRKIINTLVSNSDKVWSVAFSPDGKTLASGGNSSLIKLWTIKTDQDRTLLGHTNGDDSQLIKLWAIGTVRDRTLERRHRDSVLSVTFSKNGQQLVSGSRDKTAILWEISTGNCLQLFSPGHEGSVTSVALSPNEPIFLASGSDDRTVRFWDISNGKCINIVRGYTNWVWSVAFAPDGKTLASGGDDRKIRLWDIEKKQYETLNGGRHEHIDRVWCLAFSDDGQTLASGSDDKSIKIWDVRNRRLLNTLPGHTARVTSVAFRPNSWMLASSSHDNKIILWDFQTGEKKAELPEDPDRDSLWSIAFRPDGKVLASGSNDKSIRLFDIETFDIETFDIETFDIETFDIETFECFQTLNGHKYRVRSVVFDHTGKFLASGDDDGTVIIWSIKIKKDRDLSNSRSQYQLHQTLEHTKVVCSVSFSPNSQKLVSSGSDKSLILWDLQTKPPTRKPLSGHKGKIRSTTFNPKDATLASGSDDGTIKLWNADSGKYLDTLEVEKPYEKMNITGVKGLTDAQKDTLKALGAEETSV